MFIKFDRIKLIYNDGKQINDRILIKISNKTAMLFVDGKYICSIYPQDIEVLVIADALREYCNEHDIEISAEDAEIIAKWMKERL